MWGFNLYMFQPMQDALAEFERNTLG